MKKRTTLYIEEEILKKARIAGAEKNLSVTAIAEIAIEEWLKNEENADLQKNSKKALDIIT